MLAHFDDYADDSDDDDCCPYLHPDPVGQPADKLDHHPAHDHVDRHPDDSLCYLSLIRQCIPVHLLIYLKRKLFLQRLGMFR